MPKFITDHVRNQAHKASAMIWYEAFHGNFDVDRMTLVNQQVQLFKKHIYENVVWYDHEDVFRALLKGVEVAVTQTRLGWSTSSDMSQYRQEMEAMSAFAEIVLFPPLRRLNFLYIPSCLRTKIVDRLDSFSQLRVLIISSGSGGQWMFKSVAKKVANGLRSLNKLDTFSCKYDCCFEVIEALAESCSDSLKTLDVENSKFIDDKSLTPISRFLHLEELNIFNTKLSDESKARLLMTLPSLTRLVRGDFLCDALGWVDYLEEMEDPKFLITDFFPSQKYFFHEEWQMEMVSRMCPFINKLFFIYHETCAPNFMILSTFEYLTELCLFGGNFYTDKINELLLVRGRQLRRLNFISVLKMDYRSIATISIHCPALQSLALSNCDIGDFRLAGDPNSDVEYDRRQAFISMATEAHETVCSMTNMEEVCIYSPCKSIYLTFLLGRCPRVKTISLGKQTEISDDSVLKIFAQHGLEQLEEFHCERSGPNGLTLRTIQLLTNNCEHLRAIGDIQAWAGVSPGEVGQFRQVCHEQNLRLDTSSHQKLRKYLQMRDSERKSYVNEIAGPTLERIRLAQRAREEGAMA